MQVTPAEIQERDKIKNIHFRRGERDGLAGMSPSSASVEYMNGYAKGYRTRAERNLRGY